MYKKLLLTLILILVSAVMVFPQDLLLETHGASPALVKRDTVGNPDYLGIRDRVATGLNNVGVETKVYLMATFEDSMITGLSWSLEVPEASEASLSEATEVDSASEITTFIPDVTGTYTAIVSEGTYADTVVINAGTFLGVENNCKNCHNGSITDHYVPWSGTGHATFLDNGLNGLNGSYYNAGCISCHTVGYDTSATNDGFDDFNFIFPGILQPGMSDSMYATYPDAMDRANIQCESCHGPGSEHNGSTSESKIVVDIRPDACATCHDDDHYHVYPTQWKVSNHADLSSPRASTRRRDDCGVCHNGKGFITWVDAGKPEELAEPVDANYDITCAVCHDPHDATNVHQIRTLEATLPSGDVITEGGKGKLCMNCHNSRRILPDRIIERNEPGRAPEPHHGPQAEMLTTLNTWTWDEVLPTSPHLIAAPAGGEADACVNCHMYEPPPPIEGHEVTAGMHSFSMVSQEGEDNVGACEDCHGNVGETFAEKKYYMNGNADHDGDGVEEGLQHEVEGLLDTLYSILPQNEDGEPEIQDSTTSFDVAAAMYNWYFVEEDGSMGIHNPAFTVSILQLSIAKVKGVALSISPVDAVTPMQYSLSQNYPNPFNPYTQIDFSIQRAGKVKLVVYDMLGREVAILVNEDMAAGSYKARFDGAELASGIYMYRLTSDNFTSIKKMVLLK
jgi:hypothetical protein